MNFLDKPKKSSSPGFTEISTYLGESLRAEKLKQLRSPNPLLIPECRGRVSLIQCSATGKERYVRENDFKTGKISHVKCCGIDKRQFRANRDPDGVQNGLPKRPYKPKGITYTLVDPISSLPLASQANLFTCLKPHVFQSGASLRLDIGSPNDRHPRTYTLPPEALQWLRWAGKVIANPYEQHPTPTPLRESHTIEAAQVHWRELRRVLAQLASEDAIRYGVRNAPDFAQAALADTYGEAYDLSPPPTTMPIHLPAPPLAQRYPKATFLLLDLERDIYLSPGNPLPIPVPIQLHSLNPGLPVFTHDQSRVLVMLWAAQVAMGSAHAQFPRMKHQMWRPAGSTRDEVLIHADPWTAGNPPINPGVWFRVIDETWSDDVLEVEHIKPDGTKIVINPTYCKRLELIARPPTLVWVPEASVTLPAPDLEEADRERKTQWHQALEHHRNGRVGYREIHLPKWPVPITEGLPSPTHTLQDMSRFVRKRDL
jgi:hypothetical protein